MKISLKSLLLWNEITLSSYNLIASTVSIYQTVSLFYYYTLFIYFIAIIVKYINKVLT